MAFGEKTAFRRRRKVCILQCRLDALEGAFGRFLGVPNDSDTLNLPEIGSNGKTTQEFRQIRNTAVVMNLHF